MYHVLLVEPDESFLAVLVHRLGSDRDDVAVYGAQDGSAAVELIERLQQLDLIITVAHEPGSVDGFQLVLTGRDLAPSARLIIASSLDPSQMEALSAYCVARFIPRATSPDALNALVEDVLHDPSPRRQLDDLELIDIVVMACISERTATLHIRQDNHKGRIVFQDGMMTHAELGDMVGPEAALELMALQQGDIFLQSRIEDTAVTIHEPWLDLLIRGLPTLAERRARYAAVDLAVEEQAVITTADVGDLLGLEPSHDDPHESQSLFSAAELLEMADLSNDEDEDEDEDEGDLRLAVASMAPSLTQHSGTDWLDKAAQNNDADQPGSFAEDLGKSAGPPSGRRFARMPHGQPPSSSFDDPVGPPPPPVSPPQQRRPAPPPLDPDSLSVALFALLERLQVDIPEFVASDVVHCLDGVSVATLTDLEGYDSAALSAFYSDFINASSRGIHGFGLSPALEDVQIATDKHHILMRAVAGTPYLHLVITRRQGNLGIARVAMRRFEPLLAQILTH